MQADNLTIRPVPPAPTHTEGTLTSILDGHKGVLSTPRISSFAVRAALQQGDHVESAGLEHGNLRASLIGVVCIGAIIDGEHMGVPAHDHKPPQIDRSEVVRKLASLGRVSTPVIPHRAQPDPGNRVDPYDQRIDPIGPPQFLLEPTRLPGSEHRLRHIVRTGGYRALRAQIGQDKTDPPDAKGVVDWPITVANRERVVRDVFAIGEACGSTARISSRSVVWPKVVIVPNYTPGVHVDRVQTG